MHHSPPAYSLYAVGGPDGGGAAPVRVALPRSVWHSPGSVKVCGRPAGRGWWVGSGGSTHVSCPVRVPAKNAGVRGLGPVSPVLECALACSGPGREGKAGEGRGGGGQGRARGGGAKPRGRGVGPSVSLDPRAGPGVSATAGLRRASRHGRSPLRARPLPPARVPSPPARAEGISRSRTRASGSGRPPGPGAGGLGPASDPRRTGRGGAGPGLTPAPASGSSRPGPFPERVDVFSVRFFNSEVKPILTGIKAKNTSGFSRPSRRRTAHQAAEVLALADPGPHRWRPGDRAGPGRTLRDPRRGDPA